MSYVIGYTIYHNIKEIARLADVSPSTITVYFNLAGNPHL